MDDAGNPAVTASLTSSITSLQNGNAGAAPARYFSYDGKGGRRGTLSKQVVIAAIVDEVEVASIVHV